eukprot:1187115-Alexandrium_andersonii.AAC.1
MGPVPVEKLGFVRLDVGRKLASAAELDGLLPPQRIPGHDGHGRAEPTAHHRLADIELAAGRCQWDPFRAVPERQRC